MILATLATFLVLPARVARAGSQSVPATPIQETEPAGITWKDLVKSGNALRFYGFLRLDAYYNSARMNNIILPFTVSPEDGVAADDDDAGFALDPRLTRVGMDLLPGKVGGANVAGKLEIDFANFPAASATSSVAESRPTPRIRVAWIDVAGDAFALRVGQDWDVVSPYFPAVNYETLMWNAGNTGDRRAQIQGRWAPKDSKVDVKAALGLTGAITNEDLDAGAIGAPTTPERDGFDSGLPNLQVRAGLKLDGAVEKKPIELGAWSALGRTETDTSFGGEKHFDISLFGLDFQAPFSSALTARGELWTGQNLGDLRGGIGQSINKTTGEEIASMGGWAELAYVFSDRYRMHLGSTLDDPDNGDVPAGSPERNFTGYVGLIRDWASGLRTGFDVLYWETEWDGLQDGDALRFNLYFQYNF